MSYNNTSYNQNTSNAIQNALASIQNTSANSILAGPIYNTGLPFTDTSYKISPAFRMEMFKSENGGFVIIHGRCEWSSKKSYPSCKSSPSAIILLEFKVSINRLSPDAGSHTFSWDWIGLYLMCGNSLI